MLQMPSESPLRITCILSETGSSGGGGETTTTWATVGGGRGGSCPIQLIWGLSYLLYLDRLSSIWGGPLARPLSSSPPFVIQLDAYCFNTPCWMHSLISYMRSLQASVPCPWSMWKSHHQLWSLLWGGAYNRASDLKTSLWRVRISALLRVRKVRLLGETRGSTLPLLLWLKTLGLIGATGLVLSSLKLLSWFSCSTLCLIVSSAIAKVWATFHMSCAEKVENGRVFGRENIFKALLEGWDNEFVRRTTEFYVLSGEVCHVIVQEFVLPLFHLEYVGGWPRRSAMLKEFVEEFQGQIS